MKLFSASAVQAAVKLPVGKIGPLELTFFLNYELPKSDDITNGTMNLIIYPQLEQPDPETQGAIKCYWKGTFQSEICTFDNS